MNHRRYSLWLITFSAGPGVRGRVTPHATHVLTWARELWLPSKLWIRGGRDRADAGRFLGLITTVPLTTAIAILFALRADSLAPPQIRNRKLAQACRESNVNLGVPPKAGGMQLFILFCV